MSRRARYLLLALVAVAFSVGVAWSYLTTSGSGTASATVATLNAPAISVPATSTGSHAVTWDQQATITGNPPDESAITYSVERKQGAGSFQEITTGGCDGPLPHGTTSCTDTVASGSYTYRVIATFRSWTAESNEAGAVVVTVSTGPAAPTSVALANGGGVGNAYINGANKANLSVNVSLPASSSPGDTVHVTMTSPNSTGDGTNTTTERTAPATSGAGTVTVTGIDATGLFTPVTIRATSSNASGTSPETTTTVTKDTVKPSSSAEAVSNITSGTTFTVPYTAADGSPSSALQKVDLYVDPPGGGTNFSLTNTDNDPSASGESFSYTGATTDGTYGFYTRATDNAGNVEDAPGVADSTATRTAEPTINRAIMAKSEGLPNSTAGFIRQGGASYFIYADVTPTAGKTITGVTAVTTATGGTTTVTLDPCTTNCTVNGQTYSHKSSSLTSDSTLSAGPRGFSVTATDNVGETNTRGDLTTASDFTVSVDNTTPKGDTIDTADGAADDGEPQAGDTITFSYTETIDGISLLSTWFWPWTTQTTDVRVAIANNTTGNDTLQITNASGSTTLPFGPVNLGDNGYSSGAAGTQSVFGGTGAATASTMSRSGSTVVITLGTRSGANVGDVSGNRTISWTPATGLGVAYDAAGNGVVANSPATRTSSSDRQF